MRYYVVDAFTDAVFFGNPAGVCVAEQELSAAMMQQIAAENNLSETAFVVKRGEPGEYGLRWFTPKAEIDLCGHATLGAAYVIARYVAPRVQCMHFYTQVSGELTVRCSKGLFELDFPARAPKPVELTAPMREAAGVPVLEAHLARDLMLVLPARTPCARQIRIWNGLRRSTAWALSSPRRVMKRMWILYPLFCPQGRGTGRPGHRSAHCTLIPYWAQRLGKESMLARQLSARGGTLYCRLDGGRVRIAGKAALYLQGQIFA
jgi:predicted PhzF superfamily epimerase YddE/YHI9